MKGNKEDLPRRNIARIKPREKFCYINYMGEANALDQMVFLFKVTMDRLTHRCFSVEPREVNELLSDI